MILVGLEGHFIWLLIVPREQSKCNLLHNINKREFHHCLSRNSWLVSCNGIIGEYVAGSKLRGMYCHTRVSIHCLPHATRTLQMRNGKQIYIIPSQPTSWFTRTRLRVYNNPYNTGTLSPSRSINQSTRCGISWQSLRVHENPGFKMTTSSYGENRCEKKKKRRFLFQGWKVSPTSWGGILHANLRKKNWHVSTSMTPWAGLEISSILPPQLQQLAVGWVYGRW